MKILNLYSGIGGNRELWGDSHDITAVELDEKRALRYKSLFPNDIVVVADAHEYLLDNFRDFDFIWSSPPCQTHSRVNYFLNNGVAKRPRYPQMELYQEIIFLENFYKGLYCVENVISYYKPMIKPQTIGRHHFWANFKIPIVSMPKNEIGAMCGKWNRACKTKIEDRNKVNAYLGLHILKTAENIILERAFKTGYLFP